MIVTSFTDAISDNKPVTNSIRPNDTVISVNNHDFKVCTDYVSGYSTGCRNAERARARLGLQVRYALAANSATQADVYWAQQAYGNSSTGAQLSAIRQF